MKIRIKIVRFREDGQHVVLHPIQQGRRVMASAFETANFQFAVFSNGKESVRHWHVRVLLRG